MSCFQDLWNSLWRLWRAINQLPLCLCCSSSGRALPRASAATSGDNWGHRYDGSTSLWVLTNLRIWLNFLSGVNFFRLFNRSRFSSGYRHHNASDDAVVDLDEIPIDDDLVGGGGDPNEMNLAVRSFNRYWGWNWDRYLSVILIILPALVWRTRPPYIRHLSDWKSCLQNTTRSFHVNHWPLGKSTHLVIQQMK